MNGNLINDFVRHHAWWWILSEPDQISKKTLEVIQKTPPRESNASLYIWEFAMMATRGKIKLSISPKELLDYAEVNAICVVSFTIKTGKYKKIEKNND